jgi:Cu(I)/Ag(I) efflux system membrane protein CusA/SilA
LQSGLPQGVRIVPFYDRTRLIEGAIHTVTGTLTEEMIIACVAILLILTHLRSAIVVCVTLPMAVLISFLFMYYLGIPSNIMSLCGIAISIGILVDASVVMVENASHELKAHFDAQNGDHAGKVHGDTTQIVVHACRLVGRPIFFSVAIMLLSFLPVFSFGGQEGKLSHPLAFTKSFAMIGVAVLAITFVPALIPLLIKGRIRGEEENWIVRSFTHIYKPTLSWVIDRPAVVWWLMAVILAVGAALFAAPWMSAGAMFLGLSFTLLGTRGVGWRIASVASLLAITFLARTHLPKLGSEFMPSLDEGSILDMPTTAPRIAMGQAVDDVMVRDRVLRSFPEVSMVVGKIGRAETATDPSPLDMVETIITMRPAGWWPKRKIAFPDVLQQAGKIAQALQREGYLKSDVVGAGDWPLVERAVNDPQFLEQNPKYTPATDVLNTAASVAAQKFDAAMRELAQRRLREYEPDLARALDRVALDMLLAQARTLGAKDGHAALLREPSSAEIEELQIQAQPHGLLLVEEERQEEVDHLLALLADEMVRDGILAQRDDLLLDQPHWISGTTNFIRRAMGTEPPGFAARVQSRIELKHDELMRARLKTLNWELFDHAPAVINDLLVDRLVASAQGTPLEGKPADAQALRRLRDDLTPSLAKRLFLWQKTKDDVLQEIDSELQMPGWGNAWTQPIINRVNMLATGVRTQIGVKVFGPTGKPLAPGAGDSNLGQSSDAGAIADVQRVSQEIAAKLKTLHGAVDVVPEQSVGKR